MRRSENQKWSKILTFFLQVRLSLQLSQELQEREQRLAVEESRLQRSMAALQAREQGLAAVAGSRKDTAKAEGVKNGEKSETYLRNEIAELRAFKLEVVSYLLCENFYYLSRVVGTFIFHTISLNAIHFQKLQNLSTCFSLRSAITLNTSWSTLFLTATVNIALLRLKTGPNWRLFNASLVRQMRSVGELLNSTSTSKPSTRLLILNRY